MRLIITLIVTCLMASTARAEIIQSSDKGFIIAHKVTVKTATTETFEVMTSRVGQWWSPDHTFSGDAGNMRIDKECFCERWDGNLVRHLDTVTWIKGSTVTMEGGLGPLKSLGLSGTMIWALNANGDGSTMIDWKYHVYGFSDTDLGALASAVDGVLAKQIGRLTEALQSE